MPWPCSCMPGAKAEPSYHFMKSSSIRAVGYEDREALLPVSLRSFQGYRLLQEYFAFPATLSLLRTDGSGAGGSSAQLAARSSSCCCSAAASRDSRASWTDRTSRCSARRRSTFWPSERIGSTSPTTPTSSTSSPIARGPMDFEVYEVTDVIGHGVGR